MQPYWYLAALLFSISGMMYMDYTYKVAFFYRPKFFTILLGIFLAFFLTWDVTGIVLNVFSTNPEWVSGIYFITPDLPLEEFLFLTLFYLTIVHAWRLPECLRTR